MGFAGGHESGPRAGAAPRAARSISASSDRLKRIPVCLSFRVSMKGVERVDISFSSETVVELARRYRGHKGIFAS